MTTYQLLDADDKIFAEVSDDGKIYRTFTVGDNSAYQAMREDVITNAGAALDVDVPDWLQTDADGTLFDRQLADYKVAKARLEQYEVATGRAEETETVVVGQEWDEDAQDFVDVTETYVSKRAIDPVEPTVTRMVYSDDMDAEPTEETIENPLITKDNEERAAAQAVVDATPQAVKDVA